MNELSTEHEEPVDMTAVRVVKFKGERYTPGFKRILCAHSPTPFPIRSWVPTWNRNFKDLTGIQFGRFTVIGLEDLERDENGMRKFRHEKPALWVVRCACGNYSKRRTKSVLNPTNTEDCCETCRQTDYEKRAFSRGFAPRIS